MSNTMTAGKLSILSVTVANNNSKRSDIFGG